MKKLLLLFILLTITAANDYSQWKFVNPAPTNNYLRSVYFVNSDTGFISGDKGTFLRTADAGEHWESKNLSDSLDLSSIVFEDTQNGYLIASGSILKTTNGGNSWTKLNTICYVTSMYFENKTTGFAVGQNLNLDYILKTDDAGESWTVKWSGQYFGIRSIMFKDKTAGFVLGGDKLLRSTDAGENWQMTTIENMPPDPIAIFSDSINGLIIGSYGFMMRTSDGGSSWSQTAPAIFKSPLMRYNSKGSFIYGVGSSGEIVKSYDAGLSWKKYSTAKNYQALRGLYFTDTSTAFAVGYWGTILKSNDGGATWKFKSSRNNINLYSVYFCDKSNGYSGGDDGVIFKTTDSGKSWTEKNTGTGELIYSICFTDITTGYAASTMGTISKTTDGGDTWTKYSTGRKDALIGITFTDKNTGYACAMKDGPFHWGGYTLKTIDAGQSWNIIDSCGNDSFYDGLFGIKFIDQNTGFVYGGNGLIRKTTDAGSSWSNKYSEDYIYFRDMFFIDGSTGFASTSSGLLFKTTNAGETWEKKDTLSLYDNLTSIWFTSAKTGYMVKAGDHLEILKTNDGGEKWDTTYLNQENVSAIRIFFSDSQTGYCVGEKGTILKFTENNSSAVGSSDNHILPEKYQLFQNYPNPFNPSTTISYSIPKQSYVELKVYDLLGREVAALINKEQNAGVYKTQFNASSLPSGIYIYTIHAGQYTDSKKLMILK